jgi:ABC-2 type transport system permease protein
MTILVNNLKRIIKNKLLLFVIVILPAVLLTFVSSSIAPKDKMLSIGICDLDQTEYTKLLQNQLAQVTEIKSLNQEQINNELFNSKIIYVLVIDKGFTEKMLAREEVSAKSYFLKDNDKTQLIQKYIEDYLNTGREVAKAANGDQKYFYNKIGLINNAYINMQNMTLLNKQKEKAYMHFGAALESILIAAVIIASVMQIDRENKTFYRTLMAPVSLRRYTVQNVLSYLIISVIQMSVIFFVLSCLGIYTGISLATMYFLFLAASIVSVALGTAIGSLTRSTLQTLFTGIFIAFLMSLLGGCLWEHETATTILNNIGKFTPTYWIMDGVSKLLANQGIAAISGNLVIVLMFSMIFLFLGSWKKEEIAK